MLTLSLILEFIWSSGQKKAHYLLSQGTYFSIATKIINLTVRNISKNYFLLTLKCTSLI